MINPYPKEQKEAILARMMPPNNESVRKISKETGISEATLYVWKKEARLTGYAVPSDSKTSDKWSSEDKFLIVLETYTMNESELAEYCRKKGIYREQIEAWKRVCMTANNRHLEQSKIVTQELKEEKVRAKKLEKELREKEKALAEAAALLLLRKKALAIWGDLEGE